VSLVDFKVGGDGGNFIPSCHVTSALSLLTQGRY